MTAAFYILRRISKDPVLAYYFDPMTESMEILTREFAEQEGIDIDQFRKSYYGNLKFSKPTCKECGQIAQESA